jgi:hypothetical protein
MLIAGCFELVLDAIIQPWIAFFAWQIEKKGAVPLISDFFSVILMLLFFLLATAYVSACERL